MNILKLLSLFVFGITAIKAVPSGLTVPEASTLIWDCYGIDAALIRSLVSYDDQNFLVKDVGGNAFVLKISSFDGPREKLECENAAIVKSHSYRTSFCLISENS